MLFLNCSVFAFFVEVPRCPSSGSQWLCCSKRARSKLHFFFLKLNCQPLSLSWWRVRGVERTFILRKSIQLWCVASLTPLLFASFVVLCWRCAVWCRCFLHRSLCLQANRYFFAEQRHGRLFVSLYSAPHVAWIKIFVCFRSCRVDYCGPPSFITDLSSRVKRIVLLDHHKTAIDLFAEMKSKGTLPPNGTLMFCVCVGFVRARAEV